MKWQALGLLLIAVLLPATANAVRAIRIDSPDDTAAPAKVSQERIGTITNFRTGGATIAIDGVLYLYSEAETVMHYEQAAYPEQMKLGKGKKIRFRTEKSKSGGMELVKDIWMR